MQCLSCRGTLRLGHTSYTVNRKGYHLILDDVPAWICDQCGEPLFDEDAVRVIQAMIREMDDQIENLITARAA